MIAIQHLYFSYKKRNALLNDLNLVLHSGHVYGLLGKNGSGKSTLLRNIAGLTFPHAGQCLIDGVNTARRSVSLLQDIYFIPEEVYVPHVTAVQFAKSTASFYPKFNASQYYGCLKTFEVDAQLSMHHMSHGQQKKVLIAFALATNTRLLIMDEPTNGLDIPSKVQFRKLIASALAPERCIIISTHQVRDLDNLIDHLLVLNNSKIVLSEAVDELMQQLEFGALDNVSGWPVLYEEKSFRGSQVIVKNTGGKPARIDLELLFNGIMSGSAPLLEFVKPKQHA